MGHAADGFDPVESLFDPLAVFDRKGGPPCRVVRPSIAECRDFCATLGVTQVGDELGRVEALVGVQRQLLGRF